MIGLSVGMLVLALDERFVWWEGPLLLGTLAGYTVFQVRQGKAVPGADDAPGESTGPTATSLPEVVTSLLATIRGSTLKADCRMPEVPAAA